MNKKRKPGPESPVKEILTGYGNPEYTSEDIYNNYQRVLFNELGSDSYINDSETENASTGEDLDIPGAELDDANEQIGEEDEENNYYSLGGESHDDLEENNGAI